jgi:hypothetical protein
MKIRDDRVDMVRDGQPPTIPTAKERREQKSYFEPDAVMHVCPDCNREHFVTVLGCPSPADAARDVAMTERAVA